MIIFSALFIILQFIAACSGPVCAMCCVDLGYVQVAAGIIIHYQVYRVEWVHKDHPFEWASEWVHSKSAQLHRARPRLTVRSDPLFRCLVIKVQVLRGGRLAAVCCPSSTLPCVTKTWGVEIITPDVLVSTCNEAWWLRAVLEVTAPCLWHLTEDTWMSTRPAGSPDFDSEISFIKYVTDWMGDGDMIGYCCELMDIQDEL